MDDAGGDRLQEHVAAVKKRSRLEDHMEHDEHLDPSRWWFASSAFPMIAGTFGPMASAFSICALVKPWRQQFMAGSDIQKATYIDDPAWLLAINAVQLAVALVANMSLLLNMARKLRFTIAQPITIAGWYISAICLVALVASGPSSLQIGPADELLWSQSYYYGIYAAILYFVVASLMVFTFWGAYTDHYDKDFELTTSQRTLMLQTILFLMYMLLGSLVFCNVESWNYLDTVYWSISTLFTVGFGDLYPQTTLGRALLFPYSLIGIISLGLVIGSIRSLVLERGRHKLHARMVEKKRRKLIRELTRKGLEDLLVPIDKRKPKRTSQDARLTGLTEFQRRELEFQLMRKIQDEAAQRRRWMAMLISSSTWAALWLVGAKIFQECEVKYQNWDYFQGLWFCFVSLATIGYGDVTPISPAGKSLFVFWSLMAVPTTTVLISNAGDTIVKVIRDGTNFVGNVTILPGERGFKKDWKSLLRAISCGVVFKEDIEETPPGFLGDAQPTHPDESDDEELEEEREDLEREHDLMVAEEGAIAAGAKKKKQQQQQQNQQQPPPTPSRRGSEPATTSRPRSVDQSSLTSSTPSPGVNGPRSITFHENVKPPRPMPSHRRLSFSGNNDLSSQMLSMTRAVSIPRQTMPDIPDNKADLLVVLIDEIGNVTRHLKHKPPRKYDFQEWAFYLALIGEDESNAESHRQARPHKHGVHNHKRSRSRMSQDARDDKEMEGKGQDSDGEGHTKEQAATQFQWSWVGSRSPLMGSQEEAEWILEKLTMKLAAELRDQRDGGDKVGK